MAIWSNEIKELEKLCESLKGQLPDLEKELEQLIKFDDPNVIMLYSRRCLEVIITDLCECELKRPRKTEPLKGIIDKLHKEEKVPSHIITSMHGLNELSTYGAHPKDFDPEQIKPVLNNLDIIIKWYLKYKDAGTEIKTKPEEEVRQDSKVTEDAKNSIATPKRRLIGLVSGLVLLIVIVVAVLLFTNIIGNGRQTEELEKSIAVLPFINDSPDNENSYFFNGIMEEILNNLQAIKDLRVISRPSVEKYRNQTIPIPEIAKELDVNYIVVGSGQKYGNTVRLRVRLIKALKERNLWAKAYEQEIKDLEDIFRIQCKIAVSITEELKAVVTPKIRKLIGKIPTDDLDAYDLCRKGQYFLESNKLEDLDSALKYFEIAKEIDPEFARAYAGISDIYINLRLTGIGDPIEAGQNAIEAAEKALELDSTLAEAHLSMANLKTFILWDWKGGESAFQKAIELKYNFAYAHASYAHLLNILGQPEEALNHGELAVRLDPNNAYFKSLYAVDLLFLRRYDDAITVSYEALKLEPSAIVALLALTYSLRLTGKYEEALKTTEEFYKKEYKNNTHVFNLDYNKIDFAGTMKLEADTLVAQLKSTYVLPSDIAYLYNVAGDEQQSLKWIEQAYAERDPNLPYLLSPIYDNLRDEPRFQEIARKMNLPYK
jgi:TolB-like protein/Tfp pilus assembly protein PilF